MVAMLKLALRDIKAGFGRWMSIFIITALGMGFMVGLSECQPSMLRSYGEYLEKTALFDWRAISNVGFDENGAEEIASVRGIRACEGAIQLDALCIGDGGSDEVMRFHSLTENVNRVHLLYGRMPASPDECLADSKRYGEADLGSKVRISESNEPERLDNFLRREYTVVGVCESPIYIHWERGNTSLGSGTVRNFIFIPREGFKLERFTELYIKLETEAEIYSESYDRILRITERRFRDYADTMLREKFDEYVASGGEVPEGVDGPELYLMSRKQNLGYAGFENDTGIVTGVAKVFPVFFFLVAALVAITTVTRLVEEQRTELGILMATGYSGAAIALRFLIYTALASLGGCITGFIAGSAAVPWIIWKVYSMVYKFGELRYSVDWTLGGAVTAVYVLMSCAASLWAVRSSLLAAPAELLLPKPPKSGKRVALERAAWLWNRLDPSKRASVRNLSLYKQRLFMMVLGISGCVALMVAGGGISDTIRGIAGEQFEKVSLYQYVITLTKPVDDSIIAELKAAAGGGLMLCEPVYEGAMEIEVGETVKSVTVVAAEREDSLDGLVDFHSGSRKLMSPKKGEALICTKLAESLSISVGDSITVFDGDRNSLTVRVSGVFDNYFYNYIFISASTLKDQWGEAPEMKTIYAREAPGTDIHAAAAKLLDCGGVLTVTVSDDVRGRVDSMLRSMDYIVWFTIICSAALSFTVLYNLTNINILERIREIATVKVLGFRKNETNAFVFAENLALTALGTLFGLPLGTVLHSTVIDKINIDLIHFDLYIAPKSYISAVFFTFLFVIAVDAFMALRLEKIHMAEALKSKE